MLQCVADCYIGVQVFVPSTSVCDMYCVAACCSVKHRFAVSFSMVCSVLLCCSVLQCVAVFCIVLQCLTVACAISMANCNTLHYMANCNTLHYMANLLQVSWQTYCPYATGSLNHRIPYLYESFSANAPYNQMHFCENYL